MTDFKDFKGTAKRIEDIDLPRIGWQIGVGEDELHAFMDTEAAGSGFDRQGRPKMLFEPHVFYRNLSGAKRDEAVRQGLAYQRWGKKPYPKDSYPRLKKALKIDETAALMACSWGLAQILGENYAMVGYDSPQAMVLDFMEDEDKHLEAAVKFIVASGIDDEMRELAALTRPTRPEDCIGIVAVYNGPGFRKNNYHVKFADAHNKWRGIRDTPWTPGPLTVGEGEDIYDGDFHPVIKAAQERLDELGYPEVGAFDGRWGSKTRAAVLAFRADNGLPVEPVIDDGLLAALMLAEHRPVSPERANATVADLREKGAEDVKAADLTQVAGGVAAAGGTVGVITEVLDGAEQYSGLVRRAVDLIDPIKDIITDNFWILLIGFGGVVIWQTGVLKNIRLRKHQTGMDVSE